MQSNLHCGQIVWAEIADANGYKKGRPVLIITPDDLLVVPGLLDVVAITSTIPHPLPDNYVLLPWHAQKHQRTGLNRKSAAVCSWIATISTDEIENIVGDVPGPVFAMIAVKVQGNTSP